MVKIGTGKAPPLQGSGWGGGGSTTPTPSPLRGSSPPLKGRGEEAHIWAALHEVPDPEIPVLALTDLGIIREVDAERRRVVITPTYTGCPATFAIETSIRAALDEAGFGDVAIETTLTPPWTTDWITPEGREKLRAYGIAPPIPKGTREVECPQCGSTRTEELSRFGSTPCKAQWRCRECLEPFDLFKCH